MTFGGLCAGPRLLPLVGTLITVPILADMHVVAYAHNTVWTYTLTAAYLGLFQQFRLANFIRDQKLVMEHPDALIGAGSAGGATWREGQWRGAVSEGHARDQGPQTLSVF